MPSTRKKKLVILGEFTHEGITTTLHSLGITPVHAKLAGVLPRTWRKRARMLQTLRENNELAGVVLYLHTTVFLKAAEPEYSEALFAILEAAEPCRTIAFVYQDNLDGIFSPRQFDTGEPKSREQLQAEFDEAKIPGIDDDPFLIPRQLAIERYDEAERLKDEIQQLTSRLLEATDVAPFYLRSDVTLRLQEFLEDIDQGVFLRLFVPSDRYQADQIRGLLSVLERYMKQVEGTPFGVDARKSDRGVVYVFKLDASSEERYDLTQLFARFDSFMRICGDDPTQAEELLRDRGYSSNRATQLVGKFSKDYRRLLLDTRHEFESKLLGLKQRMETEMIDGEFTINAPNFSHSDLTSLIPVVPKGSVLHVNFENVSVVNANVQTEIDQLVNGSITYNDNDKLLHELFDNYAVGIEATQLRSDLDQLKDSSIPEANRATAKQRIMSFLRKAGAVGGKVLEKTTTASLSKYLLELMQNAT